MEQVAPVLSVTVRREVSGISTRLLEYTGDPPDDQLEVLLDHVTQLVTLNRADTHVDVVIGAGREHAKFLRFTEAVLALRVACNQVNWTIQ